MTIVTGDPPRFEVECTLKVSLMFESSRVRKGSPYLKVNRVIKIVYGLRPRIEIRSYFKFEYPWGSTFPNS